MNGFVICQFSTRRPARHVSASHATQRPTRASIRAVHAVGRGRPGARPTCIRHGARLRRVPTAIAAGGAIHSLNFTIFVQVDYRNSLTTSADPTLDKFINTLQRSFESPYVLCITICAVLSCAFGTTSPAYRPRRFGRLHGRILFNVRAESSPASCCPSVRRSSR